MSRLKKIIKKGLPFFLAALVAFIGGYMTAELVIMGDAVVIVEKWPTGMMEDQYFLRTGDTLRLSEQLASVEFAEKYAPWWLGDSQFLVRQLPTYELEASNDSLLDFYRASQRLAERYRAVYYGQRAEVEP